MLFNLLKKKQYLYYIFMIFIFLCASYSLGLFDKCFVKSVADKNYDLGDFSYTGKILDGKFEGEGKIILKDGSFYDGLFKDGVFNGDFTYKSVDNWSLKGIFEKGDIINGELIADNGKALLMENNEIDYKNIKGWSYNGTFDKTGQCGKGTFIYSDGSKYVGMFLHGLANKYGTYCSKDGTVIYKGYLNNGLFTDTAIYTFNSARYEGEFINGLPEGMGVYTASDGWTYDGAFKEGVFNGTGTIIDAYGNKTTGIWKDGRRVL